MPLDVCLLLIDGCAAANATLALETLEAANRFAAPGEAPFRLRSASLDGRAVQTLSGQRLQPDHALADVGRTDLVLLPGFLFTLREALPRFAAHGPWLRQQHASGATLAAMCTAGFVLAECGLLAGRRATTHWAFAALMRRRHPDVRLDERQILCEDERLLTSGGATAAMDLLHHLLQRHAPPELAQRCAHHLLVDAVRPSQEPYAQWAAPRQHGDEAVLRVQDWLDAHHTEPLAIDALARRFGFGERNFKRRFKEATGLAPLAYVQALRLAQARQLLETTRLSVDVITARVGYEDASSFRRLFQQRVGLAPTAYRKRFQPAAVTPTGRRR